MSKAGENAVILFVLALIAPVLYWFALIMPIHVDEAITYRYFVSDGFKVALTSYRFPNNHVLFSLLAGLPIPFFKEPTLAMRLVSVIAGLANAFLLFKILREKVSVRISIYGVLLWITSLGGFVYATHARGYGLQLVFVLLSILTVMRWKKALQSNSSVNEKMYLIIFAGASCLGFFTIPTFWFPFVSVIVWMVVISIQEGIGIKQIAGSIGLVGFLVAVGTVVLYFPLVSSYGLEAITNNQWVQDRKIESLNSEQIIQFGSYLGAYLGWSLIGLSAVALGVVIVRRRLSFGIATCLFLFTPTMAILTFGYLPYSRVFTYLVPVLVVFVLSNLGSTSTMVKNGFQALIILAICGSTFSLYQSIEKITSNPTAHAEQSQMELDKIVAGETIYVNDWDEYAHLIEYYAWKNKSLLKVEFVYADDFWEYISSVNGVYVLESEGVDFSDKCHEAFRKPGISVYRCD
ncbi:MAG: hypothetical protein ACPGU4_02115 [Flavobacteriales bacterium]